MRKFWIGLLIGLVVVWVVLRRREESWEGLEWRPGEVGGTVRIPLPEEPATEPEETEPEAATAEAAEPAEAVESSDTELLDRVRAAIEEAGTLEGYCVRCQTRRPIADPVPVLTSNRRPAVRGSCSICGTKVFRFVKV